MTPRSLFNIVLKILGIFFIKDILVNIPQLLSVIFLFANSNDIMEGILTFGITALVLAVNCLISYYLIFKSELIINKLKLDKGFDQEMINLNIHRSVILSISIIVLGGLILVQEIPDFCWRLVSYFQEKELTRG